VTEIVGETRRTADFRSADRRACFDLLRRLFLGVRWNEFVRDFDEKDAVMLLRDAATGTIGGFSTVTELELAVGGEPVPVVFSGDTAVLPEYRKSLALGQELARCFREVHERHPGRRVFYLLISKGWRTYKILPFFFREFFPRHDAATPPFERALIDAFGAAKYPGLYSGGVIRFGDDAPRLRPDGVDALPVRQDAHTAFFLRANSGYLEGDELVCAARIEPANFTAQTMRLLGIAGRSASATLA
jgi:hypothetical protein